MAGLKLTGEYEFTDDGVRIVGRIHDTKIADLRNALLHKPQIAMFAGEHIGVTGEMYHVIHPGAINAWKLAGVLKPEDIKNALRVKVKITSGSYVTEDLENAGIRLENAFSSIMTTKRVGYYVSEDVYAFRRRSVHMVNQFNVGWVYSHTQSDGSFDMTLKGLCNRHILTMLLQRATSFSRFLDGPMLKLLDDPIAIQSVTERTIDYGHYGV